MFNGAATLGAVAFGSSDGTLTLSGGGSAVTGGVTVSGAGVQGTLRLGANASISGGVGTSSNYLKRIDLTGAATATFNSDVYVGLMTESASSAFINPGHTLTMAAGSARAITLTSTGNDFGTVVIGSAADVSLYDKNDLTLGGALISGTLTATTAGNITVTNDIHANAIKLDASRSTGRSISLGSSQLYASASGDAITVATQAGSFSGAAGDFHLAGSGRFLVYAKTTNVNAGGYANASSYYNTSYSQGLPGSIAGSRFVYSDPATLTITIPNYTAPDYGGGAISRALVAADVSGLVNGDAWTAALPSAVTAVADYPSSQPNAGTYQWTLGAIDTSQYENYTINIVSGSVTVPKKTAAITLNDVTIANGSSPQYSYSVSGLRGDNYDGRSSDNYDGR